MANPSLYSINSGRNGSGVAFGEPLAFFNDIPVPSNSDECILWPYSITGKGYGQLRVDGAARLVHRMMCEKANGPIPADKTEAAHRCGQRRCLNPSHLRWATRKENASDKQRHGTVPNGERNGHAKLNENIVREIRALSGAVSQNEMAKRFSLRQSTVSQIVNGRRWAHVK